MKKACGKNKGFTLFETVLVAAVFLIVGTLLASILVKNTGLYNGQSSTVTAGLNTNDAESEIENYVRQASSVVTGYPEVSPTYTTGISTLVLKIPAVDATGVISNTFDYAVITIDQVKSNLLKEYVFPNALSTRTTQNKVLTNILQSITFSYLDRNDNVVATSSAEKVKTQITVISKNGSQNKTRSAIIVTNLRNL